MRWAVAVSIGLIFAFASCKGGGDVVEGNVFSPQAIDETNDLRLDPAADEQSSAVSGQLSITGFTVLDETGLPVMDGPGAPKATARLLDPGDDILSEQMPGVDGRFLLATTEPVTTGIVEIEFRVEEDVDGDGEGEDTISQRIPVALKPGRTATLSLELNKGEADGIDSELAVAPQNGTGEFMLTRYEALDANGSHESFYGTFFATGSVVYDVDRDEFLEIGDDVSGSDSNTNGWADDAEALFAADPAPMGFLEGVISGVNTASQQFTVRLPDGSTTTVSLQPFAGLEVLDEDGQFVGPTSLGPHLVGRQAYVEGSTGPGDTFLASWVVVFD